MPLVSYRRTCINHCGNLVEEFRQKELNSYFCAACALVAEAKRKKYEQQAQRTETQTQWNHWEDRSSAPAPYKKPVETLKVVIND